VLLREKLNGYILPTNVARMGMVKGLSMIIISIFVSLMLIASPFGIVSLQFASAQVSQEVSSDVNNNNDANSLNLQDIPLQKVHVGDIDVAYKMFGKGEPILLIQGVGGSMDSWEPSILKELSSNHTVIIFDNRGVGNTTTGTKQFSIQQFANDTVGLLDGLKIQKANVLGFSMGSFIAQQLAVTHPEKLNRLLLVAPSCGGKESIPQSPENLKLTEKFISILENNTPIEPQEWETIVSWGYGPTWIKLHPNLRNMILETIPTNPKDLVPSFMTLNAYMQQNNAVQNWKSTNWSGVCSQLTKISQPTLVMTGTEDLAIPGPANSIIIAGKITGAWLVQIPAAGHSVMDQYPAEVAEILNTFLNTTTTAQASNATSTATAATTAGTNNTTTTTTTTNTNTNTTTSQPTMNSTST
jgi:pimeloyl-ACP methyl ester carboxylesterase